MATQHKVFHCAPQSILASSPALTLHVNDQQAQSPRRGKRTRKAAVHTTAPLLSASASSWGVADTCDEGVDSTSESDGEYIGISLKDIADSNRSSHAPAKKRRHLGLEDVGRFASMSIDRDNLSGVTSPIYLPSPEPLREMLATSVEEPESENDDTAMQGRRGPSIHQLDSNRFYVTSLSDDSSDEEANADKVNQDRIDTALQAGTIEAQEDGSLIVNGVLIDQLQAMESQRRKSLHPGGVSLRRRDHDKQETAAHHKDQGALILWKNPEHLSLLSTSNSAPMAMDSAPPVVLEDGDFAYVHRPASIALPGTVCFTSQEQDDAMEIDD